MSDLAGRIALVSGAGNGIGAAVARRLDAAGAHLILVGRRRAPLDEVAAELTNPTRVHTCDVSDPGSVDQLFEATSSSNVSILINNAGVAGPTKPLVRLDPEEWNEVFAVNALGVFLMCRVYLPPMVAAGTGDVINVASVSGKRPLANRTPYVASKAAVIALTASLAYEVGQSGVSVNSLSPGPVRGERMLQNFERTAQLTGSTAEEAEQQFVERSALRRMVEEDEVAQAVEAMLHMPGLCGADIDLSAGMVAR